MKYVLSFSFMNFRLATLATLTLENLTVSAKLLFHLCRDNVTEVNLEREPTPVPQHSQTGEFVPGMGGARTDKERDVGRGPRIFAIIINYLHDS